MWLWIIAKEPNNKVWNVMIEQQAQERWLFLLHEISWKLRHDHAFIITKKRRRIDDDNKKKEEEKFTLTKLFCDTLFDAYTTCQQNKHPKVSHVSIISLDIWWWNLINATTASIEWLGKKKWISILRFSALWTWVERKNWMNEWTRLMAWKLCERDNIIFPSWDEMKCT